MKIIKKNLKGFKGNAVLVEAKKEVSVKDFLEEEEIITKYFIISSVIVPFSGYETLVFPATKDEKVISWTEIIGYKNVGQKVVFKELEDMFEK